MFHHSIYIILLHAHSTAFQYAISTEIRRLVHCYVLYLNKDCLAHLRY